MYQTPPPPTSNAAAARPRNNPFFELPAVAASGADSEDSSNIDPPKAASSELTSGSRPRKGSDADGATEEKEMGATSAGTVAEGLGGVGAGCAMCESGASQPGTRCCSTGTGAGVAAGEGSAWRESGASQSGTLTSSTWSISYETDFGAVEGGFGSGLVAGFVSWCVTPAVF